MITITATASATRVETTARGVLVLQLTVDETDPYLSLVSASVGWGDGQVEDFPLQAKPLGPLTLEHAYAPGTYYVSVVAFNAATPNPARAAWVAPFTVVLANQSNKTVYVGDSGLTVANILTYGFALLANTTVTISLGAADALYGVSAQFTVSVSFVATS